MEANFVTTGTMGIVDLGASQTVIGDKQVPELFATVAFKCPRPYPENLMQLDVPIW